MNQGFQRKKIAIVSRSFYPMNSPRSFRATELAKEFSRQGHRVTVFTVKDHDIHTPFEKEHNLEIKDIGPLSFRPVQLNGNGVHSVWKRVLRRGGNLLFEYPDIELMWRVKQALAEESGYDMLISVAVPHPVHWGVSKVWKKNRKLARVWVADCGDPYMGAALDTFKKMFYFKYFEKRFCRNADFITVPVEEAKQAYYPEFHEKIRVIPQGFDFDKLDLKGNYSGWRGTPRFGYAGSLIPGGRDPGAFLEYLVSQESDYHFILYTRSRAMIEPFVNRGKGRIEIRDYIPRKQLLEELSELDFLVNFENDTTLQLPSKLIDYYQTGRPVLSVKSGKVDREVTDRFLKGDFGDRYCFRNMERFRIENVCREFLNLLETPVSP